MKDIAAGWTDKEKERAYDVIKNGSAALIGVAALVLTISFGIVTVGIEGEAAKDILKSVRNSVMWSGGLLLTSVISGGFSMFFLFRLIQLGDKSVTIFYATQLVTFVVGLLFMFQAVWIRLSMIG